MERSRYKLVNSLRARGESLDEISKKTKVPRSTVYYWINKKKLSKKALIIIESKRTEARKLGGKSKKIQRIELTRQIESKSIRDIGIMSDRDLFMIGIALYWGEGSKQNEKNISQCVSFTNSDPKMMKIYCKWLTLIKIAPTKRKYTLYLHVNYKKREKEIKIKWEKYLSLNKIKWHSTVYKKSITQREIDDKYNGMLRISLKKSTNINRKISGWIKGVTQSIK